uniref:C2 domain-containing protein n=1 Tax=Steinernema glaseri TaxID=37863 RepID=A0A1I8AD26_9BILA
MLVLPSETHSRHTVLGTEGTRDDRPIALYGNPFFFHPRTIELRSSSPFKVAFAFVVNPSVCACTRTITCGGAVDAVRRAIRELKVDKMNLVNEYIMFRLLFDNQQHPREGSAALRYRHSTAGTQHEAFCSPVVPHVPIRQRLSQSRRCNSADVHEVESFHAYGPRRRRMSLLQNLRYQNKQLADSGFNCHSQRTDSEPQNDHYRAYRHDSASESPERHRKTTSFSSFSNIKAKTKAFFRKERKGSSQRAPSTDTEGAKSSTDCLSKEYRRKSPSTNDSGHGSQGKIDEIVHEDVVRYKERRPSNSLVALVRKSNSCPHLDFEINTCRCGARAPICKSDLSEDFSIPGSSNSIIYELQELDDVYDHAMRNSSPVSAIDQLIRRRLERKAHQQSQMNGSTPRRLRKTSLDETNIVEM